MKSSKEISTNNLQNSHELVETLSKANNILFAPIIKQKVVLQKITDLIIEDRITDWCTIDLIVVGYKTEEYASSKSNELTRRMKKIPLQLHANPFYELVQECIHKKKIVINSKTNLYIPIRSKKDLFNTVIVVPLQTHDKIIGSICFINSNSSRKYSNLNLLTLQLLANKISVALEKSRLFQESNEQKRRLDELVSSIPSIVWEVWGTPGKADNHLAYISDYAQKMLGYSTAEWFNNPNFWLSIMHEGDRDKAIHETLRIYKKHSEGISRYRWITKDGKLKWIETRTYVIKDHSGKSIGMRNVSTDITQSMKLEKEKDEFIALASHELKTPLTTIKAYTQLLDKYANKSQDNKIQEYTTKMTSQIEKIQSFIDDLLDISRIETGKFEIKPEIINFKEIYDDLAKETQARIKTHKVVYHGDPNQLVICDKLRIEEVLTNLINNAVKYSPKDKKIILNVEKDNTNLKVIVKDFGIGIPKDKHGKIFTRFYRAAKDNSISGLGLGLYICSEIVKRHKSQLKVNSQSGVGSTFYFRLPLFEKSFSDHN